MFDQKSAGGRNARIGPVQLRIKPPGYWRCFIHVGTVRWVQQELESPVFVFGVELTDSPAHVMRRWLAYVERARTARRR